MPDVALLKMGLDIGILFSSVLLAYKIVRSPIHPASLQKLKELSGTIKELIGEAEEAGASISDELLKRKKELELALSDAEAGQKSLNREIVKAEDQINAIKREAEKFKRDIERIDTPVKAVSRSIHEEETVQLREEEEIVSQSFHRDEPAREVLGFASEPPSFSEKRKAVKHSLASEIEKDHISTEQLQAILEAAKQSASRTNAIKAEAIKEALEKAKASAAQQSPSQADRDPRLGVLGGFTA